MSKIKFVNAALLCLFCIAATFAQTSKGFIVGTVADPTGAVVPNANITITNTSTGTVRSTVSQSNGTYRFDAIDPGTYNLEVSATGFTNAKSENIVVASAQTAEVNLQLSVGGASATVNVLGSDSNVQLQTTDGARANTLEQRQITELPVAGLNPTALVFTLPGVADVGQTNVGGFVQGTEFSVNGLRARANNQLIDGLDNNDNSVTGQAYQPTVRDGYSEVAILQSNYSAEYGRAGGAITNVVTRSGTNDFHGSAYDIIQNSAFDSLTPGQRTRGLTKVPQFNENTFGGSLGGPLRLPRFGEGGRRTFGGRNKLFFFGTFQADLFRNNSEATAVVPTVAGFNTLQTLFPAGTSSNLDYYRSILGGVRGATNTFNIPIVNTTTGAVINNIEFGTVSTVAPQPVNTYDYITRVDYTPNQRDSFSVRYLATKQNFVNQFPTVFQGFEVDVPSLVQNFYTSYTRNFSSRLTNEFRFGIGSTNVLFAPRNAAIGQSGASVSFSGQGLNTGISGVGLSASFPQGREFKNYQFQDTVTYTVGRQTFRSGVDLNVQRGRQLVPFNSRGSFGFSASGSITSSVGSPFTINAFQNFIQNFSGSSGSITRVFGSQAVEPDRFFQNYFINDEWRVRDNLTVNLGLRYENYGTPYNKAAYPAFAGFNVPINTVVKQKADNNNFAPRFSFAYSPDFAKGFGKRLFGERNTVIRGGFAVSYDVFFNNILSNTAAASPNVASTTILGRTGAIGGNPRGLSTFGINQLPTGATLNPLASITSIDPNLINPETYVYNLGIQRRLPGDFIADVAYVGSRGLHLFINEQENPFVNGSATRLNPSRGSVLLRTNGGDSDYNSLQARLERGFKNGFLMRATYTFSKTIDDVNSEVFATTGGTSLGSNPFNRRTDRGVADYDVPQIFTFTSLLNSPTFGTEGIARKILGGFVFGAIYRIQSGAVANPYVGGIDLNGDGSSFNDRPAISNPNAPANSVAFSNAINGTASATGYSDVNGNPISLANARYVVDYNLRTGIAARNTLRGPRFQRLDASLTRNFGLGFEKLRFQLRADFFNVLNRPNYLLTSDRGDVTNTLFNDAFTQAEGSSRSGRIQLRLTF
ncbi:MAG: carboxypeptidase regulatory-like domain-containing protein [Pyrinomonadaceae bacterium]